MKWNDHSKDIPEGSHAFLGASKYHWLNYSEDKLKNTYISFLAKKKGTELHEFACQCIKLKQKLPNSKKTLNMFVNDAIGFKMYPEQPLKYSNFCFGTADAIVLDKKNILRVHDLKTGKEKASMNQLYVYVGLFCLEYDYEPSELNGIITRIYQNDNIVEDNPSVTFIESIIDKIVVSDQILQELKEKGYE